MIYSKLSIMFHNLEHIYLYILIYHREIKRVINKNMYLSYLILGSINFLNLENVSVCYFTKRKIIIEFFL